MLLATLKFTHTKSHDTPIAMYRTIKIYPNAKWILCNCFTLPSWKKRNAQHVVIDSTNFINGSNILLVRFLDNCSNWFWIPFAAVWQSRKLITSRCKRLVRKPDAWDGIFSQGVSSRGGQQFQDTWTLPNFFKNSRKRFPINDRLISLKGNNPCRKSTEASTSSSVDVSCKRRKRRQGQPMNRPVLRNIRMKWGWKQERMCRQGHLKSRRLRCSPLRPPAILQTMKFHCRPPWTMRLLF